MAKTEVSESYINGPHAEPPFEPSISHSCNIVITIRNGALKQRGVGDLACRGDLEEFSTNAGRDIEDLSLEYVTSAEFCRALFVISLIGLALEVRKFDWRNFYRQCLRHPAEWWLQVCMRLASGIFVDERKMLELLLHRRSGRLQGTGRFPQLAAEHLPNSPLVLRYPPTLNLLFILIADSTRLLPAG